MRGFFERIYDSMAATELPVVLDADGDFARAYYSTSASMFVVRPDGYLGLVGRGVLGSEDLVCHLKRTFR